MNLRRIFLPSVVFLAPSSYETLQFDHDQNKQKITSPLNKVLSQHESPSVSTPFLLKRCRHAHPLQLASSFY